MPSQAERSKNKSRGLTQTQQTSQKLNLNVDEQVNDLVRYFINRAGAQATFKRNELKKNVLSNAGHNFQNILEKATDILKKVYGYNVLVIDAAQNSTKGYVVTTSLPFLPDPTETVAQNENPEDVNKVLILLILSHIFMSNNLSSDISLYEFLKSMGIDIERRHEIFGNVKEFINGTLKNKKYLNIETDQMSKKVSFSWGIKAEKEISKHEILKFVCNMYKTSTPNSWVTQYKSASEQHFENEEAFEDDIATQNTQE